MSELIDAKGLACPEPVILTKKALTAHDDVTVLVDNTTALENVKRFGVASACAVDVAEEAGGIYRIRLVKRESGRAPSDEMPRCDLSETKTAPSGGPTVFVFSSASMGHGNDDLGAILMKAFIHTTVDLDQRPDVMIFYNTGVTLVAADSGVVDDLKTLEEKGVKILVCGTCVNFFELGGKLAVGTVSNMYDIASTLSTAGRIVAP
jgi:selenium metabolism protein YedF